MSLEEYIEQHSSPENEVLSAINRDTNIHVLNPHMLSGQVQGRVLSFLSQMIRPRRILELGTFTGYSALCLNFRCWSGRPSIRLLLKPSGPLTVA